MPLMEEFKKLLMEKAKGAKSMDDKEIQAKTGLLDNIDLMMDDMMADQLKKITIAAPDKEGLKAGLEVAEDKLEDMPEGEEDISDEKKEIIKKLLEAKRMQEMKETTDPKEAGLEMLEEKMSNKDY